MAESTPVAKLDAPPVPVARPTDRAFASTGAKKPDAITDWLRNGSVPDTKDVTAAQRALVKLGYDLQPNGAMGVETVRALHDFEKSHNLPISSEITPRLLARINAATR